MPFTDAALSWCSTQRQVTDLAATGAHAWIMHSFSRACSASTKCSFVISSQVTGRSYTLHSSELLQGQASSLCIVSCLLVVRAVLTETPGILCTDTGDAIVEHETTNQYSVSRSDVA